MAEREPSRIDPMLDALQELWHRHPDYRLTQLVVNLTGKVAPEVFYCEDEALERQIHRWLEHGPTKWEPSMAPPVSPASGDIPERWPMREDVRLADG